MHAAVDLIEDAISAGRPPKDVHDVTHRALNSALTVIRRSDDSGGIIGDACRRLLELHPRTAAAAQTASGRLVDWMIKFTFENEVDYFELDPVAYAPALGDKGMAAFRARVEEYRDKYGEEPADSWQLHDLDPGVRHGWFVIEHLDQRLAVHDRDVEAIIRTHVRDGKVPAWLEDAAKALAEIGQTELAIEWARKAMDHPGASHQAAKAAEYWCALIAEHHPDQYIAARREVFDRWPTADTAIHLHRAAGDLWSDVEIHVYATLAPRPRQAVLLALHLGQTQRAWDLAHELDLADTDVLESLAAAYESIDPVAVLEIHRRLVVDELDRGAKAAHYRRAAQRLQRMRTIAAPYPDAIAHVNELVSSLREDHKNRPRLQQEFDKVGLPR